MPDFPIIDLAEPMEEENQSLLDAEQLARVEAVVVAQPLLKGSFNRPAVADLIRLSQWIIDGVENPNQYPYQNGPLIMLGPDIAVNLEGDSIVWLGTVFRRVDEDQL